MSILNTIIAHKKTELLSRKRTTPIEILREKINGRQPGTNLRSRLKPGMSFLFICEIKKASPSRGIIRARFDPVQQAKTYLAAGADAISILTDEKFFQGSLDHLRAVRSVTSLPLLHKDFIIDKYQLYESRAAGADMILLIARVLSARQIADFTGLAAELKMEVLLELSEKSDIGKIPTQNQHLILGINNRDLRNFTVNLAKSFRLMRLLPDTIPVISESGIATPADIANLIEHGFAGALIGEALMSSTAPATLLQDFRKAVAYGS